VIAHIAFRACEWQSQLLRRVRTPVNDKRNVVNDEKKEQKKKQVFVKAKLCTNSRWTSLLTLRMSE